MKIPKLWTAIKYAKIIVLTKVRGVLKRSCQGLFNSDKQKIQSQNINVDTKSQSWSVFLNCEKISQKPQKKSMKNEKNIFFKTDMKLPLHVK